jgi:hypothetical protein
VVGERWSVDEAYVKVAGAWAYVYRALDEHGQVVGVYVSAQRATEDAAAFFRRAITATGVVPDEVMTDCGAAYPPALAATLPPVVHGMGKRVQRRIERDHQHLKGRLRPLRGFKTLAGVWVLCRAHGFLRNPHGGFYALGRPVDMAGISPQPPVVQAWDARNSTPPRCAPSGEAWRFSHPRTTEPRNVSTRWHGACTPDNVTSAHHRRHFRCRHAASLSC